MAKQFRMMSDTFREEINPKGGYHIRNRKTGRICGAAATMKHAENQINAMMNQGGSGKLIQTGR